MYLVQHLTVRIFYSCLHKFVVGWLLISYDYLLEEQR